MIILTINSNLAATAKITPPELTVLSRPETKTNKGKLLLFATCIFFTVLTLFYPAKEFSFYNFDDNEYITENPFVFGGLTKENILWAFSKTHSGHWHPLTWISHMIDIELFGLDPGAMHLENIVIHALNSCLLFFFVFRLIGSSSFALFAAAIFGFHPMRLESVVWIAERKDVLSMFFGLSALLAYQRYSSKRTAINYLLVFCLFALGLLAKPMLVTLPVLFLLVDWFTKRPIKLSLILEKVPLLILSLGSSYAVILGQKASGSLQSLGETSLFDRVANASVGYLGYLGKLFWPTGLGIFYPLISYPPGIAAGAVISLLLITWLCFRERALKPYLQFGWLWFLITLLPVSGLIQVGGQALADRWTYLPHVGLIIAAGLFARMELKNLGLNKVLTSLSVIAPLILVGVTRYELPNWQNSETVFRHTLEVSPTNFMAHTNLGAELDRTNRLDEALIHYEEAARLNPTYPQALNNLGILRARQNRISEAMELLQKSLSIRPGDTNVIYNLGLAFSQSGDNLSAANKFINVLLINPNAQNARDSLRIVIARLAGGNCQAVRDAGGRNAISDFLDLSNQLNVQDESINPNIKLVRDCLSGS